MSDASKINMRYYQPGDDEDIVELLKSTFPKWKNYKDPLKLWRWKYLDTPQRSVIGVIVDNNKIVGCSHTLIYNIKLGPEVATIEYNDDLAVDMDYRGRGFWGKMRDLRHNAFNTPIKYVYTTTVNPIVKGSWTRRNRSMLPFQVTRMVKINNINLHLQMRPMKNMLQKKYGYHVLNMINSIVNQFNQPIIHSGEFKINEIHEFNDEFNYFWEKIKDDYNFIIERKKDYLNWRFRDNERGKHIKVQAISGKEILGYIVIGLKEENGYVEGLIEDLITLKNRLDVADALFDYACKYFNDLEVNSVYYQVVVDHPYQNLSKRKGFVDSRSRPTISFGYADRYKESTAQTLDDPLRDTDPSQVCFNYAETI